MVSFKKKKNKGSLVICLFVYRLMDCQVFGCKLDSFTFRRLQLCQTLMVMTHHTQACVGFPSFLLVYNYVHIFNSSCRIQGLEICIGETYPFALFYLMTEPRKERDRDIDGRPDVDGI